MPGVQLHTADCCLPHLHQMLLRTSRPPTRFSQLDTRIRSTTAQRELQPSRLHCTRATPNSRRAGACRSHGADRNGSSSEGDVSVILLAGGSGKRMGAPIPKQYLKLAGQPIAMYSLQTFASMPEVFEIIIVCNPEYRDLFQEYYKSLPRQPKLRYAEPGKERQDSVYNGFKDVDRSRAAVVAIHDSARPLVSQEETRSCVLDALRVGAAVLGVPVKPTIKEVRQDGTVVKTLQRAGLWEVQTPQVIRPDLLEAGFELVRSKHLEVTDDVSIIEALGKPVTITRGSYINLKVTTPDDLIVAEGFLRDRQAAADIGSAASLTP